MTVHPHRRINYQRQCRWNRKEELLKLGEDVIVFFEKRRRNLDGHADDDTARSFSNRLLGGLVIVSSAQ